MKSRTIRSFLRLSSREVRKRDQFRRNGESEGRDSSFTPINIHTTFPHPTRSLKRPEIQPQPKSLSFLVVYDSPLEPKGLLLSLYILVCVVLSNLRVGAVCERDEKVR